MPEKSEDNLTLATRLNEKREEIKEMDINLEKERLVINYTPIQLENVWHIFLIFKTLFKEFNAKMEAFKERKDELERKELHFKNSICKYEQFLKVWINILNNIPNYEQESHLYKWNF